jgi:hypothetical protein
MGGEYELNTLFFRGERMGVMVGDFGNKNGVQTFRVCGTKEDLYKIITECREMGHKFYETPVMNLVYRGQWTMVLKLKVPVEVGQHD